MDEYDILRQCNKDNPDFYIEAVFGEDVLGKPEGVLAVLTEQDVNNISHVITSEIGSCSYGQKDIECEILRAGGYLLVARLRSWLNGHDRDEIVGVAIVYEGNTHIAQLSDRFFAKQLTESYLAQIAVSKDVRDKDNPKCIRGIGTALFDCVRQIAKIHGNKYVTLSSLSNPDTLKFYMHKGMLKSQGTMTHFTKVTSPGIEALASVTFHIMEYMKEHRIRSYKNFVYMYKLIHGDDLSDLIGKSTSENEQIVAKMMLANSDNSMQYATLFNAKLVINEMFGACAKPDLRDYLEFIYTSSMDENGTYSRKYKINKDNIYLKKVRRQPVMQQMTQKQQQKMLYLFNTVSLIKADKLDKISSR